MTSTSVGGVGDAPGVILVQTITSGIEIAVATDKEGTISLINGSGTIEITPVAVEIGDTANFKVQYKAATNVEGMYIRVNLPRAGVFKQVNRAR